MFYRFSRNILFTLPWFGPKYPFCPVIEVCTHSMWHLPFGSTQQWCTPTPISGEQTQQILLHWPSEILEMPLEDEFFLKRPECVCCDLPLSTANTDFWKLQKRKEGWGLPSHKGETEADGSVNLGRLCVIRTHRQVHFPYLTHQVFGEGWLKSWPFA